MDVLRIVVATAFLLAGVFKIFDNTAGMGGIHKFASLIGLHQMIPDGWAIFAAYAVVTTELVIGLGLLIAMNTRAWGWFAIGVLVVFTTYLIIVWMRLGNVDCGCFGKHFPASARAGIIRNTILAFSISPWLLHKSSKVRAL